MEEYLNRPRSNSLNPRSNTRATKLIRSLSTGKLVPFTNLQAASSEQRALSNNVLEAQIRDRAIKAFQGKAEPFNSLKEIGRGGFGVVFELENGYCIKVPIGLDKAISGIKNTQLNTESEGLTRLKTHGLNLAYVCLLKWKDDKGVEREAMLQRQIDGVLNKQLLNIGKFEKEKYPDHGLAKNDVMVAAGQLEEFIVSLEEKKRRALDWLQEQELAQTQGGKKKEKRNKKKEKQKEEDTEEPVKLSIEDVDCIMFMEDIQFMIGKNGGGIKIIDPAKVKLFSDLYDEASKGGKNKVIKNTRDLIKFNFLGFMRRLNTNLEKLKSLGNTLS